MGAKQQIAVVGSGIAGISAAWMLRNQYAVSLFERNDYFGGHTHTIVVGDNGSGVPVDTGFIVYNEPNYPHLTGLFDVLGVATQDTEMSFAASVGEPRIEYAGSDLDTLFAQRRNLVNPGFLGMVWDILRFNRLCKANLRQAGFGDLTIGGLLEREHLGQRFRDHYLLPMAAAIWSCPPQTMLDFPAASFARFFENHGLLNLKDRPQWKTVQGGSHSYVNRMLEDLGPGVRCGDRVRTVTRRGGQVEIALASGEQLGFDQVVLACHADEALALLADPLPSERQILSRFQYQPNRAILHTDRGLMPRSRRVWSSWNYLASQREEQVEGVSVTYWMNRLQGLKSEKDYFVSLNPLRDRDPGPESVIAEMTYHHPVFDQDAINAQGRMHRIQGRERIWYTGSYFGYGFHEDALRASVELAGRLGVRAPWLSGGDSRAVGGYPVSNRHRIYFTRVMHRRLVPVDYRFSYRVFSLLLDLDELTETRLSLFSLNRFNLLSFFERDHGPRDGSPLKPWITDQLQSKGIDIEGGKVRLLCFPRVLGYGFNPLSIWYCHHRDGSLRAVLAEVNNTFGEHHFYLLSDGGAALSWPVRRSVEKVFHVSPLMGMEASYDFLLAEPADRLSVVIRQYQDGKLTLIASQQGDGFALGDRRVLAALFRIPFMTFKVMVAIHWQALKIWLRGATFFPKPPPPARKVTQ